MGLVHDKEGGLLCRMAWQSLFSDKNMVFRTEIGNMSGKQEKSEG